MVKKEKLDWKAFERWDSENPDIYRLFEDYALQAINAGKRHFGAKAVAERVRWEAMIVRGKGEFRLNNNFVAFFVRRFEERHPEHAAFFRKRRSKADRPRQMSIFEGVEQ